MKTLRIREIRALGLRGGTPEGGWTTELRPDDCVHTLVAVHTDEGLVGWGSAFTSDHLVRAALDVLEPLVRGENALERQRVSETLHQHTFWQGRGGFRSRMPSAASTSRSGTCWGRRPGSPWAGCWAGATANGCGLTRPC